MIAGIIISFLFIPYAIIFSLTSLALAKITSWKTLSIITVLVYVTFIAIFFPYTDGVCDPLSDPKVAEVSEFERIFDWFIMVSFLGAFLIKYIKMFRNYLRYDHTPLITFFGGWIFYPVAVSLFVSLGGYVYLDKLRGPQNPCLARDQQIKMTTLG
ncbi:MAG TPA: hypothetical protein VM689_09320 [Aliidongia sp.]|nr:hypothetical protein [Aliidongia sp.]